MGENTTPVHQAPVVLDAGAGAVVTLGTKPESNKALEEIRSGQAKVLLVVNEDMLRSSPPSELLSAVR